MNKIIEECKVKYKGDYIQARLIAEKMQVKISVRDQAGAWHDNVEVVDLPDSVLETSKDAGFKPKVSVVNMDTDDVQVAQG